MLPVSVLLIKNAKLVFPTHPIPKKILLDEGDASEFPSEIRTNFESKSWEILTINDWINIGAIETIASCILPNAFHYYLPSILCLSVSEKNYIDWGLKAILPHNHSREPKGEWWENYFACFTLSQKIFIQKYIQQIIECVPNSSEEGYLAQIALEKIWIYPNSII